MLNVKPVAWKVILTYLVLSTCLTALINLVLFPSPFFDPITTLTGGLVDATLQANLLNILLFSVIVFAWGKLRPIHVGLDRSKLKQGLLLTLLLWITTQAIVLLINWVNGDVHINPIWNKYGVTVVLGALIAQLAGNAFVEEMEYRGFYLGQFYIRVHDPIERWKLGWALFYMAGLFALSHIPNRLYTGYTLNDMRGDLIRLFMWGLFFAVIYLVSSNLFLAIGVHALINQPTMIAEGSFPAELVVVLLSLIVIIFMWIRKQKLKADQPNYSEHA